VSARDALVVHLYINTYTAPDYHSGHK
jgi:hypothetical protein